ncbi:glycosyltransferase [Candidatus Saccharibacteria bacterium]|nr:glycosyltransferase [Candidatus Saccharibacteria bacterium]
MSDDTNMATPATAKSVRVSVLVRVDDPNLDLSPCVKSFNNQILDDMEVLFFVTQGDEFESALAILRDYAKRDKRIRVIQTKSTDYGNIMNSAMQLAAGEYLSIISPSDFVDPEMFIELFALAKKHDAEVVRSNYLEHQGESDRIHESFLKEDADKIIDPLKDVNVFYQPPVIGCGLYQKSYLENNKIKFVKDQGSWVQGPGFNIKVLSLAENIVLTEKAYLHHVDTAGHIEKAGIFKINDEYDDAEAALKAKNAWDSHKYIFEATKFASFFLTMLRIEKKEDLTKFVLRTRAEFFDANNKKLLIKRCFPKDHWKYLQAILKYPPQIFLASIKKFRKK